ncbi:unnamed protein product [Rangifer tarandus platyrhynchus]|uniref:Uncharacterized protein n=1 Tax=Rangifer tarandus platyrhynchus TaxID=3082113 RepID=A0ABN8Y2K8_RANTA|nr:unnamed protein product [Rangifer tarandus platyrhynchus]
MEISASPFIQWCFCMCQEGLKSSLEPCQDMGHRAGLRLPMSTSWSKEGLRVLKVEAQPSVGLEEAHLLSACCAHLGGHGQGTAEAGPPGSPRECVMLARLTDSGVRSGLGRAGPGGGRKAGSATWRPRAGSALATSQPRGGGTSLTGASLRVCSSSD